METVPQYARRHHEWARARSPPGLIHTSDRPESTPTQSRLEGEPAVAPGHPGAAGEDPGHPAWISGEEMLPIRSKGRMMACTFPMTFSSGTVPWNSSPMWKRESAELPRLSPITQ